MRVRGRYSFIMEGPSGIAGKGGGLSDSFVPAILQRRDGGWKGGFRVGLGGESWGSAVPLCLLACLGRLASGGGESIAGARGLQIVRFAETTGFHILGRDLWGYLWGFLEWNHLRSLG